MTKSAKRFFIDAAGAYRLLNQGYNILEAGNYSRKPHADHLQEHNIKYE